MKKLRRGINILQVNYTDLPGKVFNGYDLNCGLRKKGFMQHRLYLINIVIMMMRQFYLLKKIWYFTKCSSGQKIDIL